LRFSPADSLDKERPDRGRQEDQMATDREVQADVQAHVKSYSSFAWMMKWGTIISFIIAAIVVIIISS
jgi:hypothetical protein